MRERKEREFLFEYLDVYQRGLKLSICCCKLASGFNFKHSRIRDQFVGAIISIPLNIAEGNGRRSTKDRINFYKIARSSSFECVPIVKICLALNLIDTDTNKYIRQEILEISKMLSGLINSQK